MKKALFLSVCLLGAGSCFAQENIEHKKEVCPKSALENIENGGNEEFSFRKSHKLSFSLFSDKKQIENLDKICIVGLMTMAPINADAQELDKIFSETNELRQSIQEKKLKNVPCDQLSMGMSRDYDMAIQNGSTFVRIGSAFFKENGE